MGITDDHEILTDQGWINISRLTVDDFVATLNPLTKVLEYRKPLILYNYTNISPMYNIINESTDVCMTVSHPIYASPNNTEWALTNGSFLINQIDQYYLSSRMLNKAASIPTHTFAESTATISMNKWLQFLGMFLRYGTISDSASGLISVKYVSVNSLSYMVTNINRELTDGSQFKLISHSNVDGVSITTIKVPSYALAELSVSAGTVPTWCYRLGPAQLNVLLVDGLVSNNILPNGQYSNTNKSLIDSLQIVYLLANKPKIIQRAQDGSYYLSTQSQPSNTSQFTSYLVGYVYELSVPNFVFMARRHNKPVLL